jgi:hypothetical protein
MSERDDFRPADAIEILHAAILRADTITQVACYAADELRYPGHAAAGREFARMQILVGQAAEETRLALAQGDGIMAALTKHLHARRASRELETHRAGDAQPAGARRKKRASARARTPGARRR